MVKKILISVSLFIFSVLLYFVAGSYFYNVEEFKYVNSLIEEGNYSEAYKISGTIFNQEAVIEDDIDGMKLRAYKSLTATVEQTEEEINYIRVFEAIDFVLFDIPLELDLTNVDRIVGYINNDEIELSKSASVDWMYEECNIYSFVLEISDAAYLEEIKLFSNEEELLTLNVNSNTFLGYNTEEQNVWYDYIARYNILDLEYRVTGSYDQDEYDAITEIYNDNLENSDFKIKNYAETISDITSFKVKIVSLIIIIILLDGVCIYFFVIRTKKTNPYPVVKLKEEKNAKPLKNKKEVIEVVEETNKEEVSDKDLSTEKITEENK